MTAEVRLKVETLRAFVADVLERSGLSEHHASTAAHHIVLADMRGIQSHGVRLLPAYVKRLRLGLINPKAMPVVLRESGASLLVDGDNGLGQVVSDTAMRLCIERARASGGVASVGVRNSNHFGAAATFAILATEEQMLGVATSNGAPAMAPWGGSKPYFGANPLAVAIPAGTGPPVVFDMATSVAARARIRMAAERGETIPEGWGITRDGRPTQNPREVLDGSLLPVGGAKGFGLVLTLEILSAVLTGACFGWASRDLYLGLDGPQGLGHFFLAIPVRAYADPEAFEEWMARLAAELRSITPSAGSPVVRLPGERADRTCRESEQLGIPVAESVLDELRALGADLGVMRGLAK